MSIPKPRKVTSYSQDTKSMLDSMMSASNLPLAEQRRLRAAVAAGPSQQMAPRHKPLPVGRKPQFQDPLRGVPINPSLARQLPGGGGRLMHSDILAAHGGSLEREQFRGGPERVSGAVRKEELQNLMTYGKKQLPPPSKPRAAPSQALEPARSEEASMRDAIANEIAERQQFLDSMHALGKGGEHEARIKGEIAERLQDLKTLDRLETS
mmetsp:Transcript_39237/g.103430  ORF Transcript_39237/g.103430 Transcript_39237/m.103430 type:complete len:209 (-) Transcript_39237:203-829(-)